MLKTLFHKSKSARISPRQVKDRLSSGDRVMLLDVRTPEEYQEIHIANSISLPLDRLKQEIRNVAPDQGSEIIVYCLSGARSAAASQQLASLGYMNVFDMGGINSWPYETARGRG
jgi:phage shock protein E